MTGHWQVCHSSWQPSVGTGPGPGRALYLESTFKDQINPKRQTAFPLMGTAGAGPRSRPGSGPPSPSRRELVC